MVQRKSELPSYVSVNFGADGDMQLNYAEARAMATALKRLPGCKSAEPRMMAFGPAGRPKVVFEGEEYVGMEGVENLARVVLAKHESYKGRKNASKDHSTNAGFRELAGMIVDNTPVVDCGKRASMGIKAALLGVLFVWRSALHETQQRRLAGQFTVPGRGRRGKNGDKYAKQTNSQKISIRPIHWRESCVIRFVLGENTNFRPSCKSLWELMEAWGYSMDDSHCIYPRNDNNKVFLGNWARMCKNVFGAESEKEFWEYLDMARMGLLVVPGLSPRDDDRKTKAEKVYFWDYLHGDEEVVKIGVTSREADVRCAENGRLAPHWRPFLVLSGDRSLESWFHRRLDHARVPHLRSQEIFYRSGAMELLRQINSGLMCNFVT